VYYPHSPGVAGKILAVKELLSVENVDAESVRTREEMRVERKASRGYIPSGEKKVLEL
jgi:large subunit ribosomal protein L30